ncbi:MAG: NADH-quinone oxidoreductase subunit N [Coriobacteriia bacterium]|nr:NADH-quinone oxidoreductase subunit N [Coriobacteriia bacterium]
MSGGGAMSEMLVSAGYLAPQLIVALTGAIVLIADLIRINHGPHEHPGRPWIAGVGIAGLIAAAAAAVFAPSGASLFGGSIAVDTLTRYFDLVFIAIGIAVLAVSIDSVPRFTPWVAEFYALVIWCTAGNMFVALATDLFGLMVFLQLTSLPLIALLGVAKRDPRTREAALKYLLAVLISTALLLWGVSLVYGAFGTDDMAAIGEALAAGPAMSALGMAGLAFVLAGFAFKIAAVPFQFWVPDVYEGAPPVVVTFLSVGSKLAGFALVMRFFNVSLGNVSALSVVLAVLAAASMTLGNLGALKQKNVRRLLAYSGIAQAGYLLVGLAASSETGSSAVLFYLAAYAVANLAAFTVVVAYVDATGRDRVSGLTGLSKQNPLAAFSLAVALMSLAGLPLTVGFMAKFYVFLSAAEAGLYWLAIIAVVNAVIAFYYYLRIVWALYVPDAEDVDRVAISRRHAAVMVVGTAGIVILGVLPAPLMNAASAAARVLSGS